MKKRMELYMAVLLLVAVCLLSKEGAVLVSSMRAAEDYVPYDLTSEAVGMDTVQKRLELNGATPTWSEEDGQNYAEYVNDGVTYKVWIEDAASLEKKLEVMKSNKLAGISFWKLGFETDSIWDTIIKYTNN